MRKLNLKKVKNKINFRYMYNIDIKKTNKNIYIYLKNNKGVIICSSSTIENIFKKIVLKMKIKNTKIEKKTYYIIVAKIMRLKMKHRSINKFSTEEIKYKYHGIVKTIIDILNET